MSSIVKHDNEFKEGKMEKCLNPILRTILQGVYDTNSSLYSLRGTPHIVQMIWRFIVEYWKSSLIYVLQ